MVPVSKRPWVAPDRAATRDRPAPARDDGFRADVEGLRAVAVVAVIGFHLRLDGFAGGFVGVDVFFVVSGYLITRLLLGEVDRTGRISLPGFWARRARRLLPASVLVLVVTVIASRSMLNPLAQRAVATDALAAGGFVVNFVFAHRLGDYFGAQLGGLEPSPLLHFWSLAVEEQFYLLWPVTLLLLTRRPRHYRRLVLVVVLAVAAASLLVSMWWTRHHPTWAFFLLPARMVELLAGAAVAVAGGAFAMVGATYRAVLGWFGVAGILVAVVTYDASIPFPGTAVLLPVLATVLVLTAGGPGGASSGPVLVLGHPIGRWIGLRSYSIYLWHWPALVLAEARFGPLGLLPRLFVVALSVWLAALTYRLVENPVRHHRWLAAAPRRGLALGGALVAVAVGTGALAMSTRPRLDSGSTAAAPVLAVALDEPGPAVLDTTAATVVPAGPVTAPPLEELTGADLDALVVANRAVLEDGLASTAVPVNLRPSLEQAVADRAPIYSDGCVNIGVDAELEPCRYGPADATSTIILYGDSHAAQWFSGLLDVATASGAELIVLIKGGCPTAAVTIPTATLARTCPIWRDEAIDFIAAEHPDLLIVSGWSDYPNDDEEWATGFDHTMARLAGSSANVVVLGDNPPSSTLPASCLSGHLVSADACIASRAEVVPSSRHAVERRVAERHGAAFIDPTDWFCTDTACPVMIGDILLYRDATHITTIASSWFAPLLGASLAEYLA